MVALSQLLSACQVAHPLSEELWVSSIEQHSQKVHPGALFFAFDGLHSRGELWAKEAEDRGAVAVISERAIADLSIPVIIVQEIRSLFSHLCAAFYGNPERQLTLIGVTGTDGKSSIAEFIQQLFERAGTECGLLSTITCDDTRKRISNPYGQSTPEANDLFAFLASCRDAGTRYAVIEATSHGLSGEYDRLGPVAFSAVVITTITREHLDFHRTHQHYVEAKLSSIDRLKKTGIFVSSTENPLLSTCLSRLQKSQQRIIIGTDLPISLKRSSWKGTEFSVAGTPLESVLLLPAMVTSSVAAYATVQALVEEELPLTLLEQVRAVAGRMECIPNRLEAQICIDFAHTPDSYLKVFAFAKEQTPGRIISVIGATGRRDRSKRAEMGSIARANSDVLIYTEEDPRDEELEQIFADLRANEGAEAGILPIEIPKRAEAIAYALRLLEAGDTLLLLGKGHEEQMLLATGAQPYSEREAVLAALQKEEKRRCR